MCCRFLHISDTHLGAEYPVRSRRNRGTRGENFFRNYVQALKPALDGRVKFVIHSGDLFNRSKPPVEVVERAYEPLLRIASRGTDVFLVPGNHERSFFPRGLLLSHPYIHVFYEPATFVFHCTSLSIGISGMPFIRNNARARFRNKLEESGWRDTPADIRILAVHQLFDTARVGPAGYTFLEGKDVIPRSCIPPEFHYVAAGHVHPHQVLRHPVTGTANICYSGSLERVSFAEKNEDKGYVAGRVFRDRIETRYVRLPARPMLLYQWVADDLDKADLRKRLENICSRLNRETVCRIRLVGTEPEVKKQVRAARSIISGISCNSTIHVTGRTV